MTRIDFDLEGATGIQADIQDLERRFADDASRIVTSGAEYSIVLEFGRGPIEADSADALQFENEDGETIYRTDVSGHPPYPFFFPAIREFEANPESFLLKNSELDGFGSIRSTEDLVESIATALQNQMRKNANANRSGRSPGTHPEHPVVDTGNLVARIQVIEA